MSSENHQVKGPAHTGSLDYLEEHIIQHPKKESFFETPAFLVLYFVLLLVLGGFIGVFLALR